MKEAMYKDTETGVIYAEHDLFLEFLLNSDDIKESSGAATFVEWIENATSRNGFLEKV